MWKFVNNKVKIMERENSNEECHSDGRQRMAVKGGDTKER